jgi:hypothetical protein
LEDVIIVFFRSMACRIAVVVGSISTVEAITGGKVIAVEFSDEVVTPFHFWVDTTKGFPVDCMKGVLIPIESFFVIGDK